MIRQEVREPALASDLYALGVVLYEMLSGQAPYQHDSSARLMMMHVDEPIPDITQERPELPLSFSAGVDSRNFPDCVALGLVPITVCSDLLRPGGYARLPRYLARFEEGYNLWSTVLRTRETKQVAALNAGGAQMVWDKDQKNIFLVASGRISKIDPASGKRDNIAFSSEIETR